MALDPDAIEIVGRVILDEIVKEGLETQERLEAAMYDLTEWLTDLDVQAGDELVVIRRKETAHAAHAS